MRDEFYSLTMLLERAATELFAAGQNKRAFFVAACAVVIAREENQ